jgi:hypothetical protein
MIYWYDLRFFLEYTKRKQVRKKRINVIIWGIEKNVKVCIPVTENMITAPLF